VTELRRGDEITVTAVLVAPASNLLGSLSSHDPVRRALVVEDEVAIRDLVCLHLDRAGYLCVPAGDGREALRIAADSSFDLIVLDLMLPTVDGLGVCRAIRSEGLNRDAAILMLTARRSENDKVSGLECGADDYLTKPFGVRELVARADALMRRGRIVTNEEKDPGLRRLSVHELDLDPARRRLVVKGRAVPVTRQEFSLLYLLASQPGVVFTRARLLSKLWQGQTYVTDRSIDTLIKRVRRKVESDPSCPELIITVWGDGYKFTDV
jgi:two-component system OmpR family response regulator/two-component system alkaline phosphatase synthesis response regulator PhoP